jgi:TPR repeat protein
MGDIASARLIFGRLARTGNLDAIVDLADTFDPANLAKLRVTGSLANPAKARELYQKAAQAGSKDAQAHLDVLQSRQ